MLPIGLIGLKKSNLRKSVAHWSHCCPLVSPTVYKLVRYACLYFWEFSFIFSNFLGLKKPKNEVSKEIVYFQKCSNFSNHLSRVLFMLMIEKNWWLNKKVIIFHTNLPMIGFMFYFESKFLIREFSASTLWFFSTNHTKVNHYRYKLNIYKTVDNALDWKKFCAQTGPKCDLVSRAYSSQFRHILLLFSRQYLVPQKNLGWENDASFENESYD